MIDYRIIFMFNNASKTKMIYLIRHARSAYNVAEAEL